MTIDFLSARKDLQECLSEVARRIFATCAASSVGEGVVVALCGGRSVVGVLEALKRESVNQPAELLERLHFFMVDERLVPISDPQSNFGGLKNLLFDDLLRDKLLKESQLHPFIPDPKESDYGCARYAEELAGFGSRFTVAVVGMGEDGHIAGLFPGHPLLQRREKTFFSFYDSPKDPPNRMTAGAKLIRDANLCILLALGEGKRGAFERFKGTKTTLEECPGVLVRDAENCVVVTDLE